MSDIGKVFKSHRTSSGTVYLTDLFGSMFVVAAESLDKELVFSRTFVYTKGTKTIQRRKASELYAHLKIGNLEEKI